MAKHARYSPSKLEALEQCPCFEYTQMETKDDEESPAERGTRLHKLVETGDPQYVKDAEDKDLHQKVLDLMIGMHAKHSEPVVEHDELKVTLKDLTYGTADKILIWPAIKKAILIDWKFIRGRSVSEPADNLQLQCYAGGLLEENPELDEVETYLAAPQIDWLPPAHTYVRADLPLIRDRVEKITMACADPFKKPILCALCDKCANASRCPALGQTALTVVSGLGLPMPESFAPESLSTPEDKAKGLIIAKMLKNWGEQVTKLVNGWVRDGNDLPLHSTVNRKGNMKVDDVEAAVVAMRALLTDSEILGAMKMSITKITAAVADKEGKKTARDTVETTLSGLISRGPDVVYALRKKGDKL
jgi:hypothetical protein